MSPYRPIAANRNSFESPSCAEYSAAIFATVFAVWLSYSDLKFARFCFCACSPSKRPGFDGEHAQKQKRRELQIAITVAALYSAQLGDSNELRLAAIGRYGTRPLTGTLNPDLLDWGPYSRWHTAEFERVWKKAWRGLSGQWRYENDLPNTNAPGFVSKPSPCTTAIEIEQSNPSTTLAFFGGGKDSLVMCELLSRADLPFSTLTFSHTVYGRSTVQQELCDKVLNALHSESSKHHHKLYILGDFLDSPVLDKHWKTSGC